MEKCTQLQYVCVFFNVLILAWQTIWAFVFINCRRNPLLDSYCLSTGIILHNQKLHFLHHHVHEGLGMFPVPWSSRCSWSLHLFLGRPTFLCPFGLYCSACFGSLFVSILCMCCSHFFWYCFYFLYYVLCSCFFPNTLILFFIYEGWLISKVSNSIK